MKIKNILITGSKGFIGKNLRNQLSINKDFKIVEFNREDSFEYLKTCIKNIDFIYHLAGEVRPTSTDEEFMLSHNTLTNKLIEIMEKNNIKVPIVLASTKHASNPQNMYGKTKLDTENIIREYGKRNNVSTVIYRLSHVFGEGCKPNYNSVISTWIYNSINNLEINIFNRDIKMRYVYVQDISKDFINRINDNSTDKVFYELTNFFDTTLGEVVDYIYEFKNNINNDKYYIQEDNEFKKKLFDVYKSYI